MKVLLTIWISAVLIQEVVPSTLVRYPREASNAPSYLHTEYEAKIEQKGKHGNESFGTMSGKQAIEHDNCNDNWNAFANKCAALIKDLVASLANSVSSKPGDATNLQLHIKNTFRHLDNTHNCSCLNHTGKGLSDLDLSHIFDNFTLSTTGPVGDDDEGNSDNDDEEPPSVPGQKKRPKKLTSGTNPENEDDPNSTSNSRRQAKHEPYPSGTPKSNDITNAPSAPQNPQGHKSSFHPFLTTPLPPSEHSASDSTSSIPPHHCANKHSPPESSSIKKSSSPYFSDDSDDSDNPSTLASSPQPERNRISEALPVTEQPLMATPVKNEKPMKKTEGNTVPATFPAQTPIPIENSKSQSVPLEDSSTPKPDYDYDEPTSGSTGHFTSAKPKQDDNFSSMTDPNSYESPDYDYPTKAPNPSTGKQPTMAPVTNTNSNIPESSEPTTLSSGMSQTPSNENSYTEDMLSHSTESTPGSEYTTPACDETSAPETVTVPSTLASESPADETGDEVLITPRPLTQSQTPDPEKQKFTQKEESESETTDPTTAPESSSSQSDASTTGEGCSTTPQSAYPTDKQAETESPSFSEEPIMYSTPAVTTEKDDDEIEHSTVATVPTKSSVKNDHEGEEKEEDERTTVTMLPVGEGTTGVPEKHEDHTEVSENPVLVQPTTFQTTSEDPTPSPISTQSSTKIVPVTVATTPEDSDESTTLESKHSKNKHEKHKKHEKHHKHHHHHDDDDDDEDDCCSCESCTEEEEEESDPRKVKEKVCKSLEEARKELRAIFDKINKKLRCCRKMPHRITTNTSPPPQ